MYKYEATVRRWVDGDTVDVDIDLGFGLVYSNQRLRLYGIDAYESRTRNLDERKRVWKLLVRQPDRSRRIYRKHHHS